MSTAEKRLLTPEEYLARERAATFRSEFYRGEMFAMSGASWEHTLINSNLVAELHGRLKSGPCRVASSDLRVKVRATGLYTYPDLVIVCGEPRFEDDVQDTLLNPQVIIEILSDSTAIYDRTKKFDHYSSIPSLREYILVAQHEAAIDRFVRQADETWSLSRYRGLEAVLEFASITASVPLTDIYRGVELKPPPPPPA